MATDEQSVQRKKRFLEHFARMGNVTRAAKFAGVGRTRVYEWQEHDDAFAHDFRVAERQSTEVLDAEAWRRAVTGVKKEKGVYHDGVQVGTQKVTEYSDVLLMFLLKSRDRAKYGDRAEQPPQGADTEAIGLVEPVPPGGI